MSESQALLLETAEKVFADLARTDDFAEAWAMLDASGAPLLLAPESDGGFGGDWEDVFALLRLAGAKACPYPIGEVIVARWLAGETPTGFWTLAPVAEGVIDADERFSGAVTAAPWARAAEGVLAQLNGCIIGLTIADGHTEPHANPAGEPRDTARYDAAPTSLVESSADLFDLGAFMRVAQIAGGLDAALELSIAYANDRVQFGKPIGKFQAVQQNLAVFAEEAAAVNSAGQAAARAMDKGEARFEIAAAKIRANRAAGIGAAIAHQVHGAIGFTHEHVLHRYTSRLIAWRSEYGSDRFWSERLGAMVCARGADNLWLDLVARSDGR